MMKSESLLVAETENRKPSTVKIYNPTKRTIAAVKVLLEANCSS
jgi:hypothetical protein